MKVYFARLFLPFFIVFVACWPRALYAFALSDLAPALPYAVTAGSVVGGASIAAASLNGMALTVGMFIGYFAFCPLIDGISAIAGTTSPCVDVPASTAPGSAVPPPAAPATAAQVTTYSYSTSSFGGVYGLSTVSASAACQNVVDQYPANYHICSNSPPTCNIGQNAYGTSNCIDGVILGTSGGGASGTACPAGYTLSGSTCNLTDPYAASPNYKKRDVTRSGTSLTVQLNNLPPNPFHAKVMTVSNSNDTISVSGGDSSGKLENFSSQALPSGGSQTTITTGTSSSSTQTQITTDNTGQVIATTTVICASGMVFSATDGSVSAASCTNPQSANNGSGVVVTNTVDSPVPPGFDTAAASSVSSQSDLMPTNLSNGTAAINAIGTDNNVSPYGGDNAATKVGAGVGTSWDWWLPDIGSFTPCLSVLQDVTMHGHPIPISNFVCGYVDNLRAGLDWFLSITTGFYVFNLMFFKED